MYSLSLMDQSLVRLATAILTKAIENKRKLTSQNDIRKYLAFWNLLQTGVLQQEEKQT